MTHIQQLSTTGLAYLANLQLDDLCRIRDELDSLWSRGQSSISNRIYDKIVDGINYELNLLKSDPYTYSTKRTGIQVKKLLDYFNDLYTQGRPMIDNAVWDILNRECQLRQALVSSSSSITAPSHWTNVSLDELPVQFIPLSRSSKEFLDLSAYFVQSLGQASTAIFSITRIQNLRLWSIFQQLKNVIPNEPRRLIHGTASPAHQKLIMHHGFMQSFCPGGLIGDGVYFAVRASYSNADPYVLKRTNERRELFICQVLLGKSSQGQGGVKSTAVSSGYHSVYHLANEQLNDMFCIFNPYQAYPEYIVQYDYT